MSEYDTLLSEVRTNSTNIAKNYIPRLYQALRDEQLSPEDARAKIEHDLTDIWSKATIRNCLPVETKDKHAKEIGAKGLQSEKRTNARMDPAQDRPESPKEPQTEEIVMDTSGKPTNPYSESAPRPASTKDLEIELSSETPSASPQAARLDVYVDPKEHYARPLRAALQTGMPGYITIINQRIDSYQTVKDRLKVMTEGVRRRG